MTRGEFERLLDAVVARLSKEAQQKKALHNPKGFENRVREVLVELGRDSDIDINFDPHPHIFPDIVIGEFGIEVKFTENDTWRSVANSIFEGTRSKDVKHIYLLFGKMGGSPGVRWGRYEEAVMHVRTSHVPRFEVEMGAEQSLFTKMGVTYEAFCRLSTEEKMRHIRKYARGRLKEGERLWWLEGRPEQEHTLPMQAQLYMYLPQEKKRQLRAEAALLCPQVVRPSRSKKKYDDAVLYILTYHGILCPQARDLFSAGSVALKSDSTRGGNYILRALQDIEPEMRNAAEHLDDALFVEYWGKSVKPLERISEWLRRANHFAKGWKPSKVLFRSDPASTKLALGVKKSS